MAYGAVTRHLVKRVAELESRVSELEQFVFTEYQIFLDVCCPRGPDGLPVHSMKPKITSLPSAPGPDRVLEVIREALREAAREQQRIRKRRALASSGA